MNIRGWTVLRFTWEDVVHNPAYVVEQVKRALGIVELWESCPKTGHGCPLVAKTPRAVSGSS
jgi:hypothetical protein